MIDKINSNGVYEYPGSHNNKRKNTALRAYENTPGVKEPVQEKSAKPRSRGYDRAEDSGAQGVILDLSKNAASVKQRTAQKDRGSVFAAALRRLFEPIVQWMKNFWESDTLLKSKAEKTEQQNLQAADVSDVQDGQMQASAVQEAEPDLPPLDEISGLADYGAIADEAVKSASLEQIEQLLTRNGERRLAHNSDLLTYYDRRGRIVEMDETNKFRVLYGDKNVMKL